MAMVVTSLTGSISTTDGTSVSTASITPTTGSLIILAVESRIAVGVAGGPVSPTVTGCGLTWVEIGNANTSGATPNRQLTLFRAMGTASTGALTIDFGSETQTHIGWLVFEISGTDTTGTNGSGAIVQFASGNGTGTTALATLAALGSANNMAVGVGLNTNPSVITPGSGFSEINEVQETESGTEFQAEYALNDTTVDSTWTGSGTWIMTAVEVKEAVAAGDAVPVCQSQYRRRHG